MSTPPIIIIKKVSGHGGHHGGAWKVAYADFVTAMMALFIVLWLLNTSDKIKKAVAGYFQDPSGYGKQVGSGEAGSGETMALKKDDMESLGQKLQQAMKEIPEFQQMKDNVKMTVTGEGLRIELLESEKGMFFESGSPKPSQTGEDLLITLAKELGKLPNNLLLEGHTDSKPFAGDGAYTNWELSSDRANAARRLMEGSGLRPDQVVQVRGFADQKLWDANDSADPANRRVSVIVQYKNPAAAEGPPAEPKDGKKGGEKESKPAEKKGAGAPEAARKEGAK
ncbi:MAG TPA: flagellar motor protein MotB [Bryobacterales bacterium]|nr:flagellar motor protein MotB [Bryobacterales bacterium]